MKKAFIAACVLAAAVLLFLQESPVYGATVQVALPSFPVTLNDRPIDNAWRQYPFVIYKGITYFPMTYYDCRFLGLESIYTLESGLDIIKTGVAGGYYDDLSAGKAPQRGAAQTAAFPIRVNGELIHNSKEEYPLLIYRDITYFPLTWRFAADAFGWAYSFDSVSGLAINSGSGIGRLPTPSKTVSLPVAENGYVTAADGFYYYQGAQGKVYQAPMSDPSRAKVIYNLPLWFGGPEFARAGLYSENDAAYLSYRTEGAVMGTDLLYCLHSDGTYTQVNPYETSFGSISVRVQPPGGAGPVNDNLSVKMPGEADFRKIGKGASEADQRFYVASSGMNVMDGRLYIGAHPYMGTDSPCYLYWVDIKTGASGKVTEQAVLDFSIQGGNVYYIAGTATEGKGQMYMARLSGEYPNRLMEAEVKAFAMSGDTFYYIAAADGGLYRFGDGKAILPGGQAYNLYQSEGYVYSSFDEESTTLYRRIIIDGNGDTIYQSGDERDRALIYQDTIIYIKAQVTGAPSPSR